MNKFCYILAAAWLLVAMQPAESKNKCPLNLQTCHRSVESGKGKHQHGPRFGAGVCRKVGGCDK